MHLLHPAHISSWFLAATLALSSCASLPKDFDKPESFALSESQTDNTTLGRRAQELEARGGGGGKSGLRLLASGHDAFAARAALIQQAERSIDAQYYIMHNDLTGRLFAYQLLKAADRGVRVRLLLDDMGSDLGDEMASTLDSHPNMEVRYLNPFVRGSSKMLQVITDFNRVTRRMHNKSFTADSQISILGGRNIGDEYFGANEELDFGDLDTLVVGPAVAEVNESFDNYWNSELSYPVIALHGKTPSEQELSALRNTLATDSESAEAEEYRQALINSELADQMRKGRLTYYWGEAEVIDDEPEKLISKRSATHLFATEELKPYFANTKRELILISPYFVPTRRGADLLLGMAKRGVRVLILTNSLAATDVAAVHAGYKKYRKELLRAGIELYEIDNTNTAFNKRDMKWLGGSSKASLHAKSFVFDREKLFVGSFNFDPRAAIENTEIGIVANTPPLSRLVVDRLEEVIEKAAFRLELTEPKGLSRGKLRWHRVDEEGLETVQKKDPNTTFLQRLTVNLIGLLPIEWAL